MPRKTWEGFKRNSRLKYRKSLTQLFAVYWWGAIERFPDSAIAAEKSHAILKRGYLGLAAGAISGYEAFLGPDVCVPTQGPGKNPNMPVAQLFLPEYASESGLLESGSFEIPVSRLCCQRDLWLLRETEHLNGLLWVKCYGLLDGKLDSLCAWKGSTTCGSEAQMTQRHKQLHHASSAMRMAQRHKWRASLMLNCADLRQKPS